MQRINEGLWKQAAQLDLHLVETAHVFLTIKRLAEPDTARMVELLKVDHPHIRWTISKTQQETADLYHFVWNEHTLIEENEWGIPEPLGGIRVAEEELDLIFIPLLVCDQQGYRVGYGKGYYDRFLAKCRPDALKIGLSMFELVDKITDVDPYDIALDACLTPTQTTWFQKGNR